MNGKMDDLRLEDRMSGAGFSAVSLMQDWPDYGKGGSELKRRASKAIKKMGIGMTREQIKAEMFAGAVVARSERDKAYRNSKR